MSPKCYISFNSEDNYYRKIIEEDFDLTIIEKSLNSIIDLDDEERVLSWIRDEYLLDSTVTLYLIGQHSSEENDHEEQLFIKRELQASLYSGENHFRSGILGIVLPSMYDSVFSGWSICPSCGEKHPAVNINDSTTVKEFSYNYHLCNNKCAHHEDKRYCVLSKWEDFCDNSKHFIQKAFEKRNHPIAAKVRLYP